MKKVLYVIIGIVVLYLILCLVGPKTCEVKRSITIKTNPETLKGLLGDLKFFQEKWSPWTELDPNMKTAYEGEAGKPGHKYSWEGNSDVGKGTLEILKMEGDSVIQNLHFDGMGDSRVYLVAAKANDGTEMTWGINMEFGFFGRGMMLFMNMDKMMGADFEKGLSKLKTEVESMPAPLNESAIAYEVKEISWDNKLFIGKKGTFAFDKIQPFFAENYPKLMTDIQKAKVEPLMAPSAIYFKWDEQKGETECAAVMCVPANTDIKGWDKFNSGTGKVLHIEYYGSYQKSMNAHMAMDAYMKKNNLPMQTMVVEEYVTDPMTEKDTTKWLTNIYYVLPNK